MRIKKCFFVFLTLSLCCSLLSETLKFIGVHTNEANRFDFTLNVTASRPGKTGNFTLSGVIKVNDGLEATKNDGEYQVTGTLYASTGKVAGYAKRNDTFAKKFQQPLDGKHILGTNFMDVKVTLLSPKTKYPMDVTFKAGKVADSSEDEMIDVFVFDQIGSNDPNNELILNKENGTLLVKPWRKDNNQRESKTITFTPLPPAIAIGAKWDFYLNGSSVPTDWYCPLKVTLHYLSNSWTSPTLDFDLTSGKRSFSQTITWDTKMSAGIPGISFMWSNGAGIYVQYRRTKIKKSEFNRLTASYNMRPDVVTGGSQPNNTAPSIDSKPTTTLRTTKVEGDVEVRLNGAVDYVPLKPDMILGRNSVITTDPDSKAVFQLPSGAILILQPGTSLRIEEISPEGGYSRAIVRIMTGELIYRHNTKDDKGPKSPSFRILTAGTVASVRGTEFSMKYDEKSGMLFIDLREGKLEFLPGKDLSPMLLEAPTTFTYTIKQN